ncbi:MAG: hypothetical protein ABSA78_22625 [Candidatus Sulfotelmatobacter sp.]|jgi:hypothetical protein
MPDTKHKKKSNMATSRPKSKTAMESLLDSFGEIIETGAKKMDVEQLRESEEKFDAAIDRAVARKQRRETA